MLRLDLGLGPRFRVSLCDVAVPTATSLAVRDTYTITITMWQFFRHRFHCKVQEHHRNAASPCLCQACNNAGPPCRPSMLSASMLLACFCPPPCTNSFLRVHLLLVGLHVACNLATCLCRWDGRFLDRPLACRPRPSMLRPFLDWAPRSARVHVMSLCQLCEQLLLSPCNIVAS